MPSAHEDALLPPVVVSAGGPLGDLPDLPLHTVLSHLDRRSLLGIRAASTRLHAAATDEHLWRDLIRADFPPDSAAYVLGGAFAALGGNFARHSAWCAVQRRARSQAKAGLEVARMAIPRVLQGPAFCCASIGGGAFVVAGGGDAMGIVRRIPSEVADPSAKGIGSPMLGGAPPNNAHALAVAGEWPGHSEGMLGMSVDATAQTVVGGSFGGRLSAWRLNYHEGVCLDTLPAKRLRAILAARGVPCDDICEKADFVARIVKYRALPVAVPLLHADGRGTGFERPQQHDGTIVGVAHVGDVALSGGSDCAARVWRLSTGKCLRSLGAPPSRAHEGSRSSGDSGLAAPVDAVWFNAGLGVAYTGDKACSLVSWNVESGARLCEFAMMRPNPHTGEPPWIWAIRDCEPLDPGPPSDANPPCGSSSGDNSSSSSSSSSSGGARLLLVGSTDGVLRVADTRTGGRYVAETAVHSSGASLFVQEFNGGLGAGSSAPIAGIALAPSLGVGVFVTSSFDGCVRLWDLRNVGRPLTVLRGCYDRLCRVDVWQDVVAAGCMDGSVRMWDLRPERTVDGWHWQGRAAAAAAAGPHALSCNCHVLACRSTALSNHRPSRMPVPHGDSINGSGGCELPSPSAGAGGCTRRSYSSFFPSATPVPASPTSARSRFEEPEEEGSNDDFAASVAAMHERAQETQHDGAHAAAPLAGDATAKVPPHWPLSYYQPVVT